MTGKDFLMRIRDTNGIVKSYEDEIETLYARLQSVTARQKEVNVQTSKEDKTAETLEKIIKLKNGVVDFINELVEQRSLADNMVRQVSDYRHQTVLVKYFLQSKTLEQTAVEMNISYQWTCELRDRALKDFEEIFKKSQIVDRN